MTKSAARSRITAPSLLQQKRDGTPIVMVTAYDATFARLIDSCDVDMVLVGDSLGMVMQGHQHTLEVTLEHMVYHTRCVTRVTKSVHVVADLPFMSYQVNAEDGIRAAGRLVQEGGAAAVKLEGGESRVETVRRIAEAGIPVMGHLGLTPQSVHAFGGFRAQARDSATADRLFRDALALQHAGAYAVVLEGIPASLAERVTAELEIPTIGIGAGVGCDGQVLVMQDLLGLDDQFQPRFVKRYAQLAQTVREAVGSYAAEVRTRQFPAEQHAFDVDLESGRASSHVKPAR
ncbi:MAG: 3-methyl-2-oxobutanoate hydroxymethyltransferase [Myxococcales bacterium FL481]|nr:MAG: 3-methyl-2-oxobutanoate hydroxymethyltransferase [Myxococcales bacterium FL481]